ncbi:hypothetical protein D9757_008112 [Collybiopsis confluens]|uniref:Uncharacterized protein n=1 Tax=Collybiopsis confluens TaxID=2823264 RepID=A0A8H5H6R8_9AGAR|nr:hypothetical protein D9757_008112 [Collybiopsis confluens]
MGMSSSASTHPQDATSLPLQRDPSVMSYSNPLHPPVHASKQSVYSSLSTSGATSSSSASSNSRRRRVPFISSSKFPSSSQPLHFPITFDYQGYPGAGIPMREIYARGELALAQMMDRGSERLATFAQSGLRRINLAILWPGYEHLGYCIPIDVILSSGHISRVQLATVITAAFVKYLERARTEAPTTPEWRLDSKGIQFSQLSLLSINHVSADVWKADITVDF